MLHQHRGGDGANAAGHRCDSAYNRLRIGKAHITAQLAAFVHIDAYVNDCLAGGQIAPVHHIGPSGGDDQHIGLAAGRRQRGICNSTLYALNCFCCPL